MESQKVKVVGETANGKEVGYRIPEGKNLYEIVFKQGGEVPQELKGWWNDIRRMTLVIKKYIASTKDKKEAKDMKEVPLEQKTKVQKKEEKKGEKK